MEREQIARGATNCSQSAKLPVERRASPPDRYTVRRRSAFTSSTAAATHECPLKQESFVSGYRFSDTNKVPTETPLQGPQRTATHVPGQSAPKQAHPDNRRRHRPGQSHRPPLPRTRSPSPHLRPPP